MIVFPQKPQEAELLDIFRIVLTGPMGCMFIADYQWRQDNVYRYVCFVKFVFHTKASGSNMASVQGTRPARVWCINVFVACLHVSVHVCVFKLCWQTPWNIQCEAEVLTATAQADPSVVELPICDFKAWLMDADLAPCSLSVPFSIYQPRDVSWFTPCPSSTSCL